jgi:hypothetical protein
MKFTMKKSLLTIAVTLTLGAASTVATAALFNPFTVDETSVTGALANPALSAPLPGSEPGKITGNYVETLTFTGGASGTFTGALRWNAGQFVATDGATILPNQLNGLVASNYGLYALLSISGSYVPGAAPGTTVFTLAGGNALSVWIDPDSNTTFTGANVNVTGGEDYQIASGLTVSGTGTLDPALPTCGGGGINCGSFGTTTTFALTALGQNYFTGPNPFYNLSFQSGQINLLTPTLSGVAQTTNGSLDVVFGRVPEPASLALMGIGLMGLAASVRRRKQA